MTVDAGGRLIPIEDRASWVEALRGMPHAFAHTWTSCRAMQMTTGWPTFLYSWQQGGSRAVCAFAERGEPGRVDIVTPYGFGGVVGRGVGPSMLGQWVNFACSRDYVCGYLGLNPELASDACKASLDYVEYNDVYVLDLNRGVEALATEISAKRRRDLRSLSDGPTRLCRDRRLLNEFFRENIDAFLRQRGASSTYAFSESTWQALLEARDEVLVLGAQEPGGEIVAVSIFAYTKYYADYLFAVSNPNGKKYSAALVWAGATAIAELGVPRLSLGGGVRPGDGIAQFKERFGGRRLPLGALKQVYRPDMYESLCRQAGEDPYSRSGFFPPYRRPSADWSHMNL